MPYPSFTAHAQLITATSHELRMRQRTELWLNYARVIFHTLEKSL